MKETTTNTTTIVTSGYRDGGRDGSRGRGRGVHRFEVTWWRCTVAQILIVRVLVDNDFYRFIPPPLHIHNYAPKYLLCCIRYSILLCAWYFLGLYIFIINYIFLFYTIVYTLYSPLLTVTKTKQTLSHVHNYILVSPFKKVTTIIIPTCPRPPWPRRWPWPPLIIQVVVAVAVVSRLPSSTYIMITSISITTTTIFVFRILIE